MLRPAGLADRDVQLGHPLLFPDRADGATLVDFRQGFVQPFEWRQGKFERIPTCGGKSAVPARDAMTLARQTSENPLCISLPSHLESGQFRVHLGWNPMAATLGSILPELWLRSASKQWPSR